MNFLNLEYFIIIAEERSFSRASERLYISQQSLSEHIKKLEASLGVTLFIRGRTLALTEAGECFLQGAKEILATRDQMLRNISSLNEQKEKQLTIAVASFDVPLFLSSLLLEFSQIWPQYQVSVIKQTPADVLSHIQDINLYFSFIPPDNGLEHCCLAEDRLCIAIQNTLLEKVYKERLPSLERELLESQDPSLLSELPFLFLFEKNGALSADLEYIFREYDFLPPAGFQSENGDLNFSVCLKGGGALLAPENFLRHKLQHYPADIVNTIRIFPIDSRGLKVALALSHERGKQLTMAEKRFIEIARRYFANSDT